MIGGFRAGDLAKIKEFVNRRKIVAGRNAAVSDTPDGRALSALSDKRAQLPIPWQPFRAILNLKAEDEPPELKEYICVIPGGVEHCSYSNRLDWPAGINPPDSVILRRVTTEAVADVGDAFDFGDAPLEITQHDDYYILGEYANWRDLTLFVVFGTSQLNYCLAYAYGAADSVSLSPMGMRYTMPVCYIPKDAPLDVAWGGRSLIPGGTALNITFDSDIFAFTYEGGTPYVRERSLSSGYNYRETDRVASLYGVHAIAGDTLGASVVVPEAAEFFRGEWQSTFNIERDLSAASALMRVAQNFDLPSWCLELEYAPFTSLYIAPDRLIARLCGFANNAGAITYAEGRTDAEAFGMENTPRVIKVEPVPCEYEYDDNGKIILPNGSNIVARNKQSIAYLDPFTILDIVFGIGNFGHAMYYWDDNDGSGTEDGGPKDKYYVGQEGSGLWLSLSDALNNSQAYLSLLSVLQGMISALREWQTALDAFIQRTVDEQWEERMSKLESDLMSLNVGDIAELEDDIAELEGWLL